MAKKKPNTKLLKESAAKMAALLDKMRGMLIASKELKPNEALSLNVAAHLLRLAPVKLLGKAILSTQTQEPQDPPKCEDCGVEMELVGAADSLTGSTWYCPECGWSDDTGAH